MKQEDRQLLLKDLCARMPYGVICHYNCAIRCDTMEINKANCVGKLEGIIPFNGHIGFMVGGDKVNALFHDIKPYLRPMSSMTEEEAKEISILYGLKDILSIEIKDECIEVVVDDGVCSTEIRTIWYDEIMSSIEIFDFLNANHFDYRGLIPMGFAIEATKENNPYEHD